VSISIRIKYLAVLKALSSAPEVPLDLDIGSLDALLHYLYVNENESLKSRLFTGDAVRPDVIIFINGREASMLGGGQAKLNNGDEITFLPSVHGG